MKPGISQRAQVAVYLTKDGSEIRELIHPDTHPVRNQSLAEASLQPGQRTALHRHRQSEEIYHVLAGIGRMTLGSDEFDVAPGDSILIPPGSAHRIANTGIAVLRLLCCCAPAYAHADTDLIEVE
jgi:mannose-6-phosphate isomerase-like protein (cupin superfamily)